jgi:hypothetical protein
MALSFIHQSLRDIHVYIPILSILTSFLWPAFIHVHDYILLSIRVALLFLSFSIDRSSHNNTLIVMVSIALNVI